MMEHQYFEITVDMLPKDTILFPFRLFIYHPLHDKFILFLDANNPLAPDQLKRLKAIMEKGVKLAINKTQKETFLTYSKLRERDIPSLNPSMTNPFVPFNQEESIHQQILPITQMQIKKLKAYNLEEIIYPEGMEEIGKKEYIIKGKHHELTEEQELLIKQAITNGEILPPGRTTTVEEKNSQFKISGTNVDLDSNSNEESIPFNTPVGQEQQSIIPLSVAEAQSISQNVKQAINSGDFYPLIINVKKEVEQFENNISNCASLAKKFSQLLLTEDNTTNRIVTLSFMLAKAMGMKEPKALGDLVCAAFLHHVGLTQLDRKFSITPYFALSDKHMAEYEKHPGLSQHLIKKCNIELTDRSVRIILEHHERVDGSGYPYMKKGSHLDPLSMILGLVSHLIDFSEGTITGSKTPLDRTVNIFSIKSSTPGLEFDFGDVLCDTFVKMITNGFEDDLTQVENSQAA